MEGLLKVRACESSLRSRCRPSRIPSRGSASEFFLGSWVSFFMIFRRFFVSWALLARLGYVLAFGGRFFPILQRFPKVLAGFREVLGRFSKRVSCTCCMLPAAPHFATGTPGSLASPRGASQYAGVLNPVAC